jgi:hypothetical protein
VRELLKNRADLNSGDDWTALAYASCGENLEVVSELIEWGADHIKVKNMLIERAEEWMDNLEVSRIVVEDLLWISDRAKDQGTMLVEMWEYIHANNHSIRPAIYYKRLD